VDRGGADGLRPAGGVAAATLRRGTADRKTASRVREAALAEVEGATIERLETDADGHAAYEAHIVKADGSRATVYVDEEFEVVSVDSR
jgi:uncharacterized membrane protein YkoI